jgi:hypothetical protein
MFKANRECRRGQYKYDMHVLTTFQEDDNDNDAEIDLIAEEEMRNPTPDQAHLRFVDEQGK